MELIETEGKTLISDYNSFQYSPLLILHTDIFQFLAIIRIFDVLIKDFLYFLHILVLFILVILLQLRVWPTRSYFIDRFANVMKLSFMNTDASVRELFIANIADLLQFLVNGLDMFVEVCPG